jgi:tetratricopeptide (TPR) repeat protein
VELVTNVRVVQCMPDLGWADSVLTEAVEAAATTGDRRLAAHALVQRGLLRLFTEVGVTPQELQRTAEQAIGVFEDLGDELGLARSWRLVGQAHYLDRQAGPSGDANERALGHARRAGDRFEEREIVEWLVIALLLGPAPAEIAIPRCARLLQDAGDDHTLLPQILSALAALAAMQQRRGDAFELIERSRTIMNERGEWTWIVTFWWSFVHLWQDDPVTAEQELRPAYEALAKIGEKSHFSSIAHALAAVAHAQGRYEEAERLAGECRDACRANDVHSQVAWRSILAKILARRNELVEAEGLAREAVALAETSDFLLAHADALADLADVLELAGRPEEAARVLEDAIGVHERKGNLLAAEQARSRQLDRARRRQRTGSTTRPLRRD